MELGPSCVVSSQWPGGTCFMGSEGPSTKIPSSPEPRPLKVNCESLANNYLVISIIIAPSRERQRGKGGGGERKGPAQHPRGQPQPLLLWPIINTMKGIPDKCPCQGEILPSLRNNVISRLLPKIIYQCVIALCRPQIGGELRYQRWMWPTFGF